VGVHIRAGTGGPTRTWRSAPQQRAKTLRLLMDLIWKDLRAGLGFADLSRAACFTLLFSKTELPDRVYGPGRLPACARFLRGFGRPANLFRISRLDRCAGSARERIERNGLLSSSGVPSWGAKPDPRIEPGLESRKAATGRQFSHLSVGQTLLASKEDQPGISRWREGKRGRWRLCVSG
jgi:hypothetical protein